MNFNTNCKYIVVGIFFWKTRITMGFPNCLKYKSVALPLFCHENNTFSIH